MLRSLPRWVQLFSLLIAAMVGVAWRSHPAWTRGTYLVEGSAWLERLWENGFWHTVTTSREDYWVTGNVLAIQLGDWFSSFKGGLAVGPQAQMVACILLVALTWWHSACIVRRHFGSGAAWLSLAAMATVPEWGAEMLAFGESSNIGFFAAPAAFFLAADFYFSQRMSRVCIVAQGALLLMYVGTSPGAAAVLAGVAGMAVGRSFWQKRRGLSESTFSWAWCAVGALAVAYIIHVRLRTVGVYLEKHPDKLWVGFTEAVIGRQILYPLICHFFLQCHDGIIWIVAVFVAGLLVAVGRRDRGHRSQQLILLLILTSAGLALSTTVSRQSIFLLWKGPYSMTDPDRYYVPQNTLMAVAFLLAAWRAAVVFPRWRQSIVVAGFIYLVSLGVSQQRRQSEYQRAMGPEQIALRWPEALRRTMAMASPDDFRVPCLFWAWSWSLRIPEDRLPAALPSIPLEECRLEFGTPPEVKREGEGRALTVGSMRFLGGKEGEVNAITFDVHVPATVPHGAKQRTLWLPGAALAGARAWFYSNETAPDKALIKVWLPGPQRLAALQGGAIAFGPNGRRAVSTGWLPKAANAGGYSLPSGHGEPRHPLGQAVWVLSEHSAAISYREFTGSLGSAMTLAPQDAVSLEPAWYTRWNPLAASALEEGLVTSAQNHQRVTNAQTSFYPEVIEITSADVKGIRAFDAVQLELAMKQGPPPPNIVLQFVSGAQTMELPLALLEQPFGKLGHYLAGGVSREIAQPIERIRLLIPSAAASRSLSVRELAFFDEPPFR
jgi:hypothetical protein